MNGKPHYKLMLSGELVLKFRYRIKFRNRGGGQPLKPLLMSRADNPESWRSDIRLTMYGNAGWTH